MKMMLKKLLLLMLLSSNCYAVGHWEKCKSDGMFPFFRMRTKDGWLVRYSGSIAWVQGDMLMDKKDCQ